VDKVFIHKIFEEYFHGRPLLDVWEIGSETVIGARYEIGYKILTEADPMLLLQNAITDPKAFELFHSGIIHALTNNLHIPPIAQQFLAEFLKNPKIRPKQSTGKKSDDEFNWRLIFALKKLEGEGVKPTRSPATDPENSQCGIDIVLDVLSAFDHKSEFNYDNLARRYFRSLKKSSKPAK